MTFLLPQANARSGYSLFSYECNCGVPNYLQFAKSVVSFFFLITFSQAYPVHFADCHAW